MECELQNHVMIKISNSFSSFRKNAREDSALINLLLGEFGQEILGHFLDTARSSHVRNLTLLNDWPLWPALKCQVTSDKKYLICGQSVQCMKDREDWDDMIYYCQKNKQEFNARHNSTSGCVDELEREKESHAAEESSVGYRMHETPREREIVNAIKRVESVKDRTGAHLGAPTPGGVSAQSEGSLGCEVKIGTNVKRHVYSEWSEIW